MTEHEQLKQNTEIQYAKERAEALSVYIDKLQANCLEALQWKIRSTKLELLVLVVYMFTVGIAFVWGTNEIFEIAVQAFWLIIFLTAIRSWHFHSKWQYAEGEYDGFIRTMQIMGYFPPDNEPGKKKVITRKSLFSRFKEFFERMAESNTQEKHA